MALVNTDGLVDDATLEKVRALPDVLQAEALLM